MLRKVQAEDHQAKFLQVDISTQKFYYTSFDLVDHCEHSSADFHLYLKSIASF